MTIQVQSEIGRLRRVLVHRPGREVDRMVPSMMEELLFDDILDGEKARTEHSDFSEVFRKAGVEVLDPQDLLAEVIDTDAGRARVLGELESRAGMPRQVLHELAENDGATLAERLVRGIRASDRLEGSDRRWVFDLPPVPNYFFQRDPQFIVGDRVVISSMATAARAREPMLAKIVFDLHPALRGYRDLFELAPPPLAEPRQRDLFAGPALEGGDVLVPSPETLLVGISQRSDRRGVERLAEYLRRESSSLRHLIAVELPRRRSFMHLDTVFTFIDHGTCLAHLPVVDAGGPESAHVHHVSLTSKELTFRVCPSLLSALAEVGMELDVVPCGGSDDRIDQEREQWTDGANAFAIAPGVILLYRRNRKTVEELDSRGWRVIGVEDVVEGRASVLGEGRTVVTIQGHELSRARGGPRCMTMPLQRDPL